MSKEKSNPQVTVIVPCYNPGPELGYTLKSVSAQCDVEVEILVIDDGSCEESAAEVRKWCKRIKEADYHRLEENKGVAFARNFGIDLAKCSLIAFCDADDIWAENKLKSQVKYAEDGFLCCTECVNIDESGDEISKSRGYEGEITYERLLKTNDVICSSVLISKEQLGQNRFPDLKKRQDHALWIALARQGVPVFKLNEHLIKYRVSASSLSGNKFDAMRWSYRLLREHLGLSLVESAYYFVWYLIIGFKKQKNRTK